MPERTGKETPKKNVASKKAPKVESGDKSGQKWGQATTS